jgi:large subunit ribosomal protein L18
MNKKSKKEQKERRHKKIRAKIHGTEERPRLCVFKSNKHIYAQVINDEKGFTLVSASDLEIKDSKKDKKIDLAQKVGELIAKKAKDKKIDVVLFDRGGFKYHGRVKTLADEARKQGLQF